MRRERADAALNPMLEALAAAPLDDEPSTEEEDRTAREAIAAYERGEAIGADELKREGSTDAATRQIRETLGRSPPG
jgi:hypothetical protein